MIPVTPGLALAMSVALDGSASDIERAISLLAQPFQRDECLRAAGHLLTRAKIRVQSVQLCLGEAGIGAICSSTN